jgi:alpha-1,2-mannosyltransferase
LVGTPVPKDPDRPARPEIVWPSWLLAPGLVVFAISLYFYVSLLHHSWMPGSDMAMLRAGISDYFAGRPVYDAPVVANLDYNYPPVTLLLFAPFSWLDQGQAMTAIELLNGAGVLVALAATARMLGHRLNAGAAGVLLFVAALVLWTEPFHANNFFGQINILVFLPVVVDLALPDRYRLKGIGVGLATAMKLLPGLFVIYFLLTRRIRAAIVAAVTFAVLQLVGWAANPSGTMAYWIEGRAFSTARVITDVSYVGNQSLQGFIARATGSAQQSSPLWFAAVVVVGVAALSIAVWAHRNGEEALAMTVVGLTALLVSPVSWSQYWIWTIPLFVVLVDAARRSTGRAKSVAAAVAVAAPLPFMILLLPLPPSWSLTPIGLIWSQTGPGFASFVKHDPYVLTTLALLVIAASWLYHQRRPARG